MIKGVHTMFYSDQADALRVFLRDKLQLPAKDVGGGWLIFDFQQADMGVHPTDHAGSPPSGTHAISFTCDDIVQTVADMRGRGVVFSDEIQDYGYGPAIHFELPGGIKVEMYQPGYR